MFRPQPSSYPALLIPLSPEDRGFAVGYRFRIDPVDGDSLFAADLDRAQYLMRLHALRGVSLAEMVRLRHQRRHRVPPARS